MNPARLVGRAVLRQLVRMVGGRRTLRLVQSIEPRLVGSYSESDYPRHLLDEDFARVSRMVEPYTLVDVLRRHEIWTLVGQAAKLEAGDYLEVGVWRGGTGLLIAEALRHFGAKGTLYLADTFTGVVKAGEKDSVYLGGEHADVSHRDVANLFYRNAHANTEILVGIFPEETAHRVTSALRMVHIDVDVYQSAKDIVEWCYHRMVPGAVIVFDDYGFSYTDGVTKLCEEYEMDIRFLFVHNVNGHALLIKR